MPKNEVNLTHEGPQARLTHISTGTAHTHTLGLHAPEEKRKEKGVRTQRQERVIELYITYGVHLKDTARDA